MAPEIIRERKGLHRGMTLLLHLSMTMEHFNICPAKTIDALLSIPYRCNIRPIIARKMIDDGNLEQISILEFIHHDQLELLLVRSAQIGVILECLRASAKQIGVIEAIGALKTLIFCIDLLDQS